MVLNRKNIFCKIKFLICIHIIPSVKFAIFKTQFAKVSSLEIFFHKNIVKLGNHGALPIIVQYFRLLLPGYNGCEILINYLKLKASLSFLRYNPELIVLPLLQATGIFVNHVLSKQFDFCISLMNCWIKLHTLVKLYEVKKKKYLWWFTWIPLVSEQLETRANRINTYKCFIWATVLEQSSTYTEKQKKNQMYNLIPRASCLSDIGRPGLSIIGHLNINSIHNKFEMLSMSVVQYVDILVLSETKLDSTYPSIQFLINSFSVPHRLDRNS